MPSSESSVNGRLRAVRDGREPGPFWQPGEALHTPETLLMYSEEATGHPENRPLLSLSNFDKNGELLGEVCFFPEDVPAIVQWLSAEYSSLEKRRECRYQKTAAQLLRYMGDLPPLTDVGGT
jgi:hypothetical protein